MKNNFRIVILSIISIIIALGIVFCIIDSLRVHDEQEPIFTFLHKIVDGIDYSAKIDTGIGYKIIRLTYNDMPEQVKIGSIFMSEKIDNILLENNDVVLEKVEDIVNNDEISGEQVKMTTFDDKYVDIIMIEGMEEEIYAQNINSKIGYSMKYYFDDFDYTGYDDHDVYTWKLLSGDATSTLTVYDISDEEAYKESMENISKEGLFEELSEDNNTSIQKVYYRSFKDKEIERSNYIYIIEFNDLKLMVDLYLPLEAEEGIGTYMRNMANSISKS